METLRIEIVLKNELSQSAQLPEGMGFTDAELAVIAAPLAAAIGERLIAAGVRRPKKETASEPPRD